MRRTIAAVLFAFLTIPALAQERPLVVIDPGHGGDELGVDGGEILEKDLVLEIGLVIGAEFAKAGFDVAFTRTRDEAVAWGKRRTIAEEAGAAFLIMLHANGSDDASESGAEVYVHPESKKSAAFAGAVAEALTVFGNSALDTRPWPFLESETVATAMVELAFMTNPDDLTRLEDSAFHHEVGRSLVAAANRTLSDQ